MEFKYTSNYKDITHIIDGPYNSPNSDEGFESEYVLFREGLLDIINTCLFTESEINVGYRWGLTRGIGLVIEEEVNKSRIMNLIFAMHTYIKEKYPLYCIAVNIEYTDRKKREDLYIGITNSEYIYIHADKKTWFKRFIS